MKKIILALSLAFASSLALAHGHGNNGNNGNNGNGNNGGGVAGGVAVGGIAHGWQGSVSGTAKSTTEGAAVAVGQVAGTGYSFQNSVANSGGTATIGGVVNSVGASVGTNTTQFANVATVGVTDQAALNADGLIQNGSIGQAQSINTAKGKASFEVGEIGGFAAIGGIAGIVSF